MVIDAVVSSTSFSILTDDDHDRSTGSVDGKIDETDIGAGAGGTEVPLLAPSKFWDRRAFNNQSAPPAGFAVAVGCENSCAKDIGGGGAGTGVGAAGVAAGPNCCSSCAREGGLEGVGAGCTEGLYTGGAGTGVDDP